MAFLYTGGYTLNLVTLIGLAVGVGMLVDNSIVVYEAAQRRLERGVDPDRAAGDGVRITFKAILASTVTNAIVFLPVFFLVEDSMLKGGDEAPCRCYTIPLGSSLLVAVGLVPLLARRFAAPAAMDRLRALKRRRELYMGLPLPDRWRDLFTGLLKNSMRNPATWIMVITAALFFTIIVGLPWVMIGSRNRSLRRQMRYSSQLMSLQGFP
jgi:multidrug efflux pump subunit AcrB